MLPDPSSERGDHAQLGAGAQGQRGAMGWRLPGGDLPPQPTAGPTSRAPGAGDFSAAGWLEIEREKAGWDRQGQAAGVAAWEGCPGQSAHKGLC